MLGPGRGARPGSQGAGKRPKKLLSSLPQARRWGHCFTRQQQYGLADGGSTARKDIGQKLEKEFSGFFFFFGLFFGGVICFFVWLCFLFFVFPCLPRAENLCDKSGEAGVRWVIKMDPRREAGQNRRAGGERCKAPPRESREAGIRRAANGVCGTAGPGDKETSGPRIHHTQLPG